MMTISLLTTVILTQTTTDRVLYNENSEHDEQISDLHSEIDAIEVAEVQNIPAYVQNIAAMQSI